MTEFAARWQWLHPGNDLYLCHTEEIAAGIRERIGCPAVGNGPLVDAGFADDDQSGAPSLAGAKRLPRRLSALPGVTPWAGWRTWPP